MLRLVKYLYFPIAVLFAIGIIIKSGEYVSPDFNNGYLSDKSEHFYWFRYALYAHMTAAPLAFFCGLFQFTRLKSSYHKLAGRIYVITILFFAAPSGLIMSFLAIGGLPGVLNFLLLSVCWFFYTLFAYNAAKQGNYRSHGIIRPGEMVRTVEGLTTKVLNECLRRNMEFGILEKKIYPEVPPRVEYHFTEFGHKVKAILDQLEKLQDELKEEAEENL